MSYAWRQELRKYMNISVDMERKIKQENNGEKDKEDR